MFNLFKILRFFNSKFVSSTNNLRAWNSFTENAALSTTWILSATKNLAVWSKVFCWFVSIYKIFHKKRPDKKKIFEAIRFIRLNPTVFQITNENKQFIFSNLFTVWMTYSLCFFYINWNGTKFEIFSRKIFTLNLNFLENTLRVRLLNASMC